MKIIERNEKDATISLRILVEESDLQSRTQEALDYIRSTEHFDGFRPGKASASVIKSTVGEKTILEYSARLSVFDFLKKFLAEEGMSDNLKYDPRITVEDIEHLEKNKSATVVIDIFRPATVNLGDYATLREKIAEQSVTDQDTAQALADIGKVYSIKKPVTEPISKGLVATVDFVLSVDATPIPDGTRTDFAIRVGDYLFIEDFENQLVGMKQDETREFTFKFPQKFYKKELAGKNGHAKVTIKKIEREALPEMNNEFVQSISKFTTVDELKKSVRQELLERKTAKVRRTALEQKLSKLIESSTFNIPPVAYEPDEQAILNELRTDVERQGGNFTVWVEQLKQNKQLLEQIHTEAVRRTKVRLLLDAIATKENLLPTDEEITKILNEQLKYAYNNKSGEEISVETLREGSKRFLIQQKAINFLLS